MKKICEIPKHQISKISLYINSGKKSADEILEETGADYIINGTLYDMTSFQPVCHLRAEGFTLCSPDYTVYGYAWNNTNDFSMSVLPIQKGNYIACTPLIVQGEKVSLIYNSQQGGKRGRSAIGTKGNSICLYCSSDGSDANTPEGLQKELFSLGWDSAVMLDGGGSCQCNFNGEKISSSRRVQNLILLKKGGKNMKKVMLDPGHDAKSVNGSPDGTYKEHEFALDMGNRIKEILQKMGVEVKLTRTDGSFVSLDKRCALENEYKPDLFVSLHSNAAGSGWSSARGWSAHIIAKGGNAEKAANSILSRVKAAGVTVRSQPIVVDNFQVLRDTNAPAVLIEHGFHTNEQDTALLKDSEYRQMLASAEALGILDHLGISVPNGSEEPDSWAKSAWEKGKAKGITDGSRPKDSLSRQEAMVMFDRLGLL